MMTLKDMIPCRKSTRSFTGVPVEQVTLDKIGAFIAGMQPLYPHIRVCSRIVTREQVKCLCPWTTPQLVAIYSEDTEGALENVGFLFQQLDLYLHTLGLGTCWLGMGRMDQQLTDLEGLPFVIMLAFGHPKEEGFRKSAADFRRKDLADISDRFDPRLEPARLAPSSVNSQPWYFVHEGDLIHAFCVRQGLLKNKALSAMNRIDMGIALSHLYVTSTEHFRFLRKELPPEKKGYAYIGSFIL